MSWNFASRTVYTPACTFLRVAVLGKTLLSLSFPSSPDNTSSEIKVGNATPGPEAASALSSGTWSCRHTRRGGAQTLPSSRESSWKKEENPKGWGEGRHLHQSSEEGSEPSADRAPGLLGGYAGGMAVLPVPLLPSDQMALSSSQHRAEQELNDGKTMLSCVCVCVCVWQREGERITVDKTKTMRIKYGNDNTQLPSQFGRTWDLTTKLGSQRDIRCSQISNEPGQWQTLQKEHAIPNIYGERFYRQRKWHQKTKKSRQDWGQCFQWSLSLLDHGSQTDLGLSSALSFTSWVTLGKQFPSFSFLIYKGEREQCPVYGAVRWFVMTMQVQYWAIIKNPINVGGSGGSSLCSINVVMV